MQKFKHLESRLKKLPKTEWDYETDKSSQPVVKVWEDDELGTRIYLSTEQGNTESFEYIDCDYVVDIKPELQEWAKQYGWYWDCEYRGTYVLCQ